MKLSFDPPFRAWHIKRKKMYDVIQWSHPDFNPKIVVMDKVTEEMMIVRQANVKLLRSCFKTDSDGATIYEGDVLGISLANGEIKSIPVVFVRGILGVNIGESFVPVDAIPFFIQGVENISVIGNINTGPVLVQRAGIS